MLLREGIRDVGGGRFKVDIDLEIERRFFNRDLFR